MNAKEIIEKYNLKDYKWVHKGAHSVLHTMMPATLNLLKPLEEYWGDSFKIFVFFIIEDYLHWYYNEEDMTRLRKQFVEKLAEKGFLEKFEKEWRDYVAIFDEKCKKIDNTALADLSDEELLILYKELYDAYVKEYSLAMALLESFSMQVDVFFRPMLEKVLEGKNKDFNEVYTLLLSPIDESFINQEFKSRLNIIKAIKNNQDPSNLLEEHAKKYHWTENNYAKVRILKAEHFREKLDKEIKLGIDPDKELEKINSGFENTKIKKQELIKELELDHEMLSIIKATERFAIMQDDRKKCVLISNYYQKLFINEIGRRVHLNEIEMNYTIYHELKDILNKKFDKNTFVQRRKATLCIETLSGFELFEGDTALEVFNEVFNPEIEDKEVKGTCASTGKVKGIVKIVKKTHDLASVDKGDILVASMTRPEMVVAMEKSAGIITDEGGVTCHAAVVSRELGIPCIIGTKIATTVLKNGDYVELDADNGVVRKIK